VTFGSDWGSPEVAVSFMVDECIPYGEFADITIGDWCGYDLVAAR
jgi:ribosomal protein S12 methylthiotransferase